MNLNNVKKILLEKAKQENTKFVSGNESLDVQVDDILNSYLAKKEGGDLDVRELASDVANLIDNVNNLIEINNTILRRTLNKLSKEHSEPLARELEITLEDVYGLSIGKSQDDLYDEFKAPLADTAGPIE